MDPATGALLGGIAGDLLGGIFGSSAQKRANKVNIMLTRENRAFMERMSNTEWQRGVQDMLTAGINPMLAVSQGGASTPNTSAANVIPEDAMARAASSAGSKAMQALALQKLKAETAITTEKADQESMVTDAMRVDRYQTGDYFKRLSDETEKLKQERMSAAERARLDKAAANIKEIEQRILEQTEGAQVKSAQERAQLLEREVGLADMKKILMQLDIPEKEAMAKWFSDVGEASPAAKAVMTIGQWLKMILNK